MIEFKIDFKMTGDQSLNKIYKGENWRKRADLAKEIHDLVGWTLIGQKMTHGAFGVFQNPVKITIAYNCGLDIDNCGYMSKLIIDGLKGHLIKNDTKRYITQLTQCFWNGNGILVRVEEAG